MPLAPYETYTQRELTVADYPQDERIRGYAMAANQVIQVGTLVGEVTNASVNDVQIIATSGGPTGGTITFIFNGQMAAPVPYNATAAQIQTALQALPNVGPGGLLVTGGALGTASITVTAAGQLANQPQGTIIALSNLTGGTSPAVTVTHNGSGGSAVGVASGAIVPYNSANSDGSQIPIGFTKIQYATDSMGNVYRNTAPSEQQGHFERTARVAITGLFNIPDLVGLDANAVTVMKARIIDGSIASNSGLVKVF